jgi:chorismate mutase
VTNIGVQDVNVDTRNDGSGISDNVSAYIEGFSDPNISVPHAEVSSPLSQPSASFKSTFPANFARATPGDTLVSFIIQQQQGATRNISRTVKKIFVLDVTFDPATKTASAKTPQGIVSLHIDKVILPETPACPCDPDKKPPLQPMAIKMGSLVVTRDLSYAGGAFQ